MSSSLPLSLCISIAYFRAFTLIHDIPRTKIGKNSILGRTKDPGLFNVLYSSSSLHGERAGSLILGETQRVRPQVYIYIYTPSPPALSLAGLDDGSVDRRYNSHSWSGCDATFGLSRIMGSQASTLSPSIPHMASPKSRRTRRFRGRSSQCPFNCYHTSRPH